MRSAVILWERQDAGNEVVLVAWNRRYRGWTLPGGKHEPGETLEECARRELREETGLQCADLEQVYEAESASGSGRIVTVFRVLRSRFYSHAPYQLEAGAPVGWMMREEFVQASAFAAFHRAMFDAIGPRR